MKLRTFRKINANLFCEGELLKNRGMNQIQKLEFDFLAAEILEFPEIIDKKEK